MGRIKEGEAREVILAHARDLFLEHGANQLTLRRVASSVGVTPMALYKHFDNKEALLVELLRQGFETFDEFLSRSDTGDSAECRMSLMIEGFREFALQEGAYFELIFLTGQTLNGLRDRKEVRRASKPAFRRLVELIRDCIDEGCLVDRGEKEMAITLLAQATGLAALHRAGTFGWSKAAARRAFDTSFAATLNGYRS